MIIFLEILAIPILPKIPHLMKYVKKEDITRKHDVTVEEVKAIPMFAQFTDEQAREVIDTVKIFVEIALDCYRKQQENKGNSADF